jgi:hypothetical protein
MSVKFCHRKATSNTGIVGITETHVKGRPCFSVSWRPAPYVRKHLTIYFEPGARAVALQAAVEWRAGVIAIRAAKEDLERVARTYPRP